MTWRMWPSAICLLTSSIAAWNSSSVNGPEVSTPWLCMIRPIVSRISLRTTILPLRSGAHRSSTVFSSRPTFALSQAMPGEPALPGQASTAARGRSDVLELGQEVGACGIRIELQRLAELLADHPVGHPVGEDEDVAVDVLAVPQLRGDLAEVGVVVVDVLGVRHLHAGLLLEGLEGRVRLASCRRSRGRPSSSPSLAVWSVAETSCGRRSLTSPAAGGGGGAHPLVAAAVAATAAAAPAEASSRRRDGDCAEQLRQQGVPRTAHDTSRVCGRALPVAGCRRSPERAPGAGTAVAGQASMLAMTCLMRV